MAIVFVMEIVLIRHGQPEWLKNDKYNLDPGLTEKGTKQALLSSSIFTKGEVKKYGYRHFYVPNKLLHRSKKRVYLKILLFMTGYRKCEIVKK